MDIQKDLVSIIVPVYNVELYIEECLNSLIHQTYKNIEIIIVVDGSTDKSEDICKCFGQIDNRICIIKQENQGLSQARNTGLENAKGKYVTFVDSDDWLQQDAIYSLVEASLKEKADIVIAQGAITDKSLQNTSVQKNYYSEQKEQKLNSSRALEKLFCGKIPAYAWGKLYDISLFQKHSIRFTPNIHYEDIDIMYRLLDKAENIVILNKPIYCYRVREGSITATFRIGDVEDLLQIQRNLASYFKKTLEFRKTEFSYYQLSLLFFAYSILCRTKSCQRKKELLKDINRRKKQWKLPYRWYLKHQNLPMVYKIIAMKMGVAGILMKVILAIK